MSNCALHTDQGKDCVREGQPWDQHAEEWNKGREASAQEEQPHTPTGNRLGQ